MPWLGISKAETVNQQSDSFYSSYKKLQAFCKHKKTGILNLLGFPLFLLSPSHHNFFVRHINISSGANHTFGASHISFHLSSVASFLPGRFISTSPCLELCIISVTSSVVPSLPPHHLIFPYFPPLQLMLLNSQHFICGSKKEGGLQTSRSIVPTKNDLEISICDSDFWSSSMSSDSIIRFGTI